MSEKIKVTQIKLKNAIRIEVHSEYLNNQYYNKSISK